MSMNPRVSGLILIIFAVLATLASYEDGYYDITAAIFLIPVGIGSFFIKEENITK